MILGIYNAFKNAYVLRVADDTSSLDLILYGMDAISNFVNEDAVSVEKTRVYLESLVSSKNHIGIKSYISKGDDTKLRYKIYRTSLRNDL